MATVFIGAISHWAQSGLTWNLATDSLGNATLPGTGSYNLGCRPVVSIDNSTTVTINQECESFLRPRSFTKAGSDPLTRFLDYAIAHASKAIMPVNGGSEFGRRIGVAYSSDKMLVGAYATKLPVDGHRYSLVVYNKCVLLPLPYYLCPLGKGCVLTLSSVKRL